MVWLLLHISGGELLGIILFFSSLLYFTVLYIFYFTIMIICNCLPGVPKSDSRPAWRWRRFFISSVEDTVLELGGSGVLLLRHRVQSPWQTPIIYYIMYITVM